MKVEKGSISVGKDGYAIQWVKARKENAHQSGSVTDFMCGARARNYELIRESVNWFSRKCNFGEVATQEVPTKHGRNVVIVFMEKLP